MLDNIMFISEAISEPFDEGVKIAAVSLYRSIKDKCALVAVTTDGNDTGKLPIKTLKLNKLFLNKELFSLIRAVSPRLIIYLPAASSTFNSFVRAKVLKMICNKSFIGLIAVQRAEYRWPLISILSFLKPDLLFLAGKQDELFFKERGFSTKILRPAINGKKFLSIDKESRAILRDKYKLPADKTIILHVGHIKTNRNLCCLISLQQLPKMQVVVVGSTSTKADDDIKRSLANNGIILITDYLPDIEEVYQLSDIYVFTVIQRNAAIEMPLSVLEAMACNLPVVTTRFGGLVDYFKDDKDFRYFNTQDELVENIMNIKGVQVNNAEKVASFTWERTADEILSACEKELVSEQ